MLQDTFRDTVLDHRPAAHSVHALAPLLLNWPAEQFVQLLMPGVLNLPAGQMFAVALVEPAEQK